MNEKKRYRVRYLNAKQKMYNSYIERWLITHHHMIAFSKNNDDYVLDQDREIIYAIIER